MSIRLSAKWEATSRKKANLTIHHKTYKQLRCTRSKNKSWTVEWRRDFFFVNLAVSCFELFSDHPKIYIGWTGPTNINDGSKFCHSNIGIQNLEPSAPWTPRFLGSKLDLNSNSCRRHWLSWDATIQRCERACRIETIPFVDCIVNLLTNEKCHFETSSFKKRYMSISVYCHAKQTQKQQQFGTGKAFRNERFPSAMRTMSTAPTCSWNPW